jgi:hypothetical protein
VNVRKLGRCIRLSVLFDGLLQPGHDGVRKVRAYRSSSLEGQKSYRLFEPAVEPLFIDLIIDRSVDFAFTSALL